MGTSQNALRRRAPLITTRSDLAVTGSRLDHTGERQESSRGMMVINRLAASEGI
jgi:hypothetical protein